MRGIAGAVAIGVLMQMPGNALAQTAAEQPAERMLHHEGVARSYLVYSPPAARKRGAALPPVLMVLHGGGGRARQIMDFTRFNAIAAREGLVALYPQGLDRGWNDGREFQGRDSRKDDVGFLLAVLDDVERHGIGIDRRAVGVTGISNGGFMAMRMACDAAGRIAGIAAVTATMPAETGSRCRASRPVPVLVINGTRDPLVPYEGGNVRVFGRNRGAVWSTGRTMEFWAKVNGCSGAPRSAALGDRDPSDGTTTIRHDYQGCGRVPVTLLEVQGGGHTWPGGSQYLPNALVGPVSRDFDASEAIVAFFKSVWRPTASR
jgi:polyhydroxybutyrate depolymerase